jgi:exodeoxyribonuclease V beta subunit
MSSYSALSRGAMAVSPAAEAAGEDAVDESTDADHDGLAALSSPVAPAAEGTGAQVAPAPTDPDDILDFPRGASAGECVHAVMEGADFTDPSSWPAAIEAALQAHPQKFPRKRGEDPRDSDRAVDQRRLADMLHRMLSDVVQARLPDGEDRSPGIRLAEIPNEHRLVEWAFAMPVHDLDALTLNQALTRLGYLGPRLSFNQFQGYLRGFVDLIYRHRGRYWIIDWKSNHLGREASDYGPASVDEAMKHHRYHLQYLLYLVALHRMLKRREPGYDYDRHVGGVHYLFMRGVRPGWASPTNPCPGVHFDRPDRATIEALDALLQGHGTTMTPGDPR